MKNDNRKRLMEMMEKVNPDSVNSTPTEKEIIDDILSLDEGVGDVLSKMKEYARKGMLTATIILSVASAVAAGNVGGDLSANDVVKAGAEMVDDTHEKKVYAFFVGMADQYLKRASVEDTEHAKALEQVINYYALLWDGANPEPLTGKAAAVANSIAKNANELDPSSFDMYVKLGTDRLKRTKKQ